MAYIIPYKNQSKLVSTFVAMTPYQVYVNAIKSAIEPIRASANDTNTYIPPQLGGLEGQREIIENVVVLQLVDFEVQ